MIIAIISQTRINLFQKPSGNSVNNTSVENRNRLAKYTDSFGEYESVTVTIMITEATSQVVLISVNFSAFFVARVTINDPAAAMMSRGYLR